MHMRQGRGKMDGAFTKAMSEADLHLAKAQGLRQIELTNQTASDI